MTQTKRMLSNRILPLCYWVWVRTFGAWLLEQGLEGAFEAFLEDVELGDFLDDLVSYGGFHVIDEEGQVWFPIFPFPIPIPPNFLTTIQQALDHWRPCS